MGHYYTAKIFDFHIYVTRDFIKLMVPIARNLNIRDPGLGDNIFSIIMKI